MTEESLTYTFKNLQGQGIPAHFYVGNSQRPVVPKKAKSRNPELTLP